ncbi:replication-relaxation family protein [Streptomyces sp. NPDC005813]|uniref:replication-relaxation family protein n=1 Tax=Streptomyces sp. NPDC005813 TaxID=3155592 RepID=UPI0033E2D724
MVMADAGGGDRLALAVLAQYRMATTEQMHTLIAPSVRIEQTRRRLAKLREEGLVERITLPQAGRTRVWFVSRYGAQIASEWPELRGWQPSRTVSDPTAARLKVGHSLVVTQTGLAFVQDARRRGDVCRPLDWIPEVHHSLGSGGAVIPDALLYYQGGSRNSGRGSMLRAFIEVDRATMGPERLSAKIGAYERLYRYAPVPFGRSRRGLSEDPARENWRDRYPLFPRLLFVLDGTGLAGLDNRIRALHAAHGELTQAGFIRDVTILAVSLTDLLEHGPSAPVWRPVQDPGQRVSWMDSYRPPAAPARPARHTQTPTAPAVVRGWGTHPGA